MSRPPGGEPFTPCRPPGGEPFPTWRAPGGDAVLPVLPPPFSLVAHDTIASTSDAAKRLAAEGAPHGTLVWALEQSAGRGRLDRSWVSPRGNLFLSVVLRPERPAGEAAVIGFAAALAVADALGHFLPDPSLIALKWPNDVLVDGAKIAGLLLEADLGAGGALAWLVLGIGVNLVAAPPDTPYPAVSLARFAPAPAPGVMLAILAEALGRRLDQWRHAGFPSIRRDWLALAHPPGTALLIRAPGGPVEGSFLDLDGDGALLLATAGGMRRVSAGDVHFPGL